MVPLSIALILLQAQAPKPLQATDSLRARVAARIAQTPSRAVGVYYRDLATGDSLTLGAAVRFHAASTMKIPVMIQLFRDRDVGRLALSDSVTITNTDRKSTRLNSSHTDISRMP